MSESPNPAGGRAHANVELDERSASDAVWFQTTETRFHSMEIPRKHTSIVWKTFASAGIPGSWAPGFPPPRTVAMFSLLLVLLLCLLPPAASAYDAYGHQAICGLALRHLTPAARAALDDLIAPYSFCDPFNICSWADIVRGDPEYEAKYPNNRLWHFIDFDATYPYAPGQPFDIPDPEPGTDHIAAQIPRFQRLLADPSQPRDVRFDAVRFLAHFLGDLHEPLHCITRHGDAGGNFVPVAAFLGRHVQVTAAQAEAAGERLCLHHVWDDILLAELRADRGNYRFILSLDARLPRRLARSWLAGSARDWALESYWLGRRSAYTFTDGAPVPESWTGPGPELTPENYIDARLPILQTQLQKAGIRLAHLLNLALDPDYTPADFPLPDPFLNTTPSPWANLPPLTNAPPAALDSATDTPTVPATATPFEERP